MRKDKLPSIPQPASISTPIVTRTFGEPKNPARRIRAWRSKDIEQQTNEWRKEQERQIQELDTFWNLRMKNRP
jgi:hypothetical protein